MPTKRELAAEAEALGAQLNVTVTTDRKNHDQLTQLVEELRGMVTDHGADRASAAAAKVAEDDKPEAPSVPGGAVVSWRASRVAAGRTVILSSGRTLREGARVKAEDFHGGEETMKLLQRKGAIVTG